MRHSDQPPLLTYNDARSDNILSDETFDLIATCAFGLEAIVRRELQALGIEAKIGESGRVHFRGTRETICQTNLWLRTADRVLIRVAEFPAADFDALFDTVRDLPWGSILPVDANFPVTGRSIKSTLSSVPACQRATKRAIVDGMQRDHGTQLLSEAGAQYKFDIALLKDTATLTIDTTGRSLHRRGYRTDISLAPLKETLAAALVLLSFWKPDRPLLDPFCGSGTIPIEAARIGRNIAPGINRDFSAETWTNFPDEIWNDARSEAREQQLPPLEQRIVASDIDGRVLRAARDNAFRGGVENDIHFHATSMQETTSKRRFGCLITNPPYGERLGYDSDLAALYQSFPHVLRKLPTWSFYFLTGFEGFERTVGREADRRRKLYNGRIECTYYQYHGPRPVVGKTPSDETETSQDSHPSPAETTETTAPIATEDTAAFESKLDDAADTPTTAEEPQLETDQASSSSSGQTETVGPSPAFDPSESTAGQSESGESTAGESTSGEADDSAPISPWEQAKQKAKKERRESNQAGSPKPYVHASGNAAFGELTDKAAHQAELFTSRLKKRAKHLRRWPTRRDITCFRLYERDIPEIPLVVDRYEDHLHITEYERPHDRDPAQHANWLELMAETAGIALDVSQQNVHLKTRQRQRGKTQHNKLAETKQRTVVREGGLKFIVNLVDYVDTGLFLDHRVTRQMVHDEAKGKHFLNLFAYTGSFSVYAADGGAKSTTSVDLSQTYLDWARDNMGINRFSGDSHRYIAADINTWIGEHPPGEKYDLVVLDPPTFSNSKKLEEDWNLQNDAVPLLQKLLPLVRKGGVIYFSCNFRRFKFDESGIAASSIHEISKQTVPEDFRNRRIHRCWRIVR